VFGASRTTGQVSSFHLAPAFYQLWAYSRATHYHSAHGITERQGGTMQLRLPDPKEAVQHPLAARDFERNGTTYWVSVGGIVDPDSGYAKYSFFTVWGSQQDKRGILPDKLLNTLDIEGEYPHGCLITSIIISSLSKDLLTHLIKRIMICLQKSQLKTCN
jgi:hypothetical protein